MNAKTDNTPTKPDFIVDNMWHLFNLKQYKGSQVVVVVVDSKLRPNNDDDDDTMNPDKVTNLLDVRQKDSTAAARVGQPNGMLCHVLLKRMYVWGQRRGKQAREQNRAKCMSLSVRLICSVGMFCKMCIALRFLICIADDFCVHLGCIRGWAKFCNKRVVRQGKKIPKWTLISEFFFPH